MLRLGLLVMTNVTNVYSVESSTYIDTLSLLKVSGMLFVKIEKSKRPKLLLCVNEDPKAN